MLPPTVLPPVVLIAALAAGALAGAFAAGGAGTSRALALAAHAPPAAIARPLQYLLGAQNADGGFGGAPGQPSDPLDTAWAAMGLAAAGRNPQAVRRRRPLAA